MTRADIVISITLNAISALLNLLATRYYIKCLLLKVRKEATYQQLSVHILAVLLSSALIVTTVNRIDSLSWAISQALQICYFLAAIWYYSTIMTALSFLDAQSSKNRLNWLTSRLTGKFYKDVGIVVAGVIFILFMGRFVILFKNRPDSWMSVWYALSEFGSILFYFLSLSVAVDVALKITNVSRKTRMLTSDSETLVGLKNKIFVLLLTFSALYLLIVVIGSLFIFSKYMRPIASALGGLGAVLFSMIFENVIKYFSESLALANNMDTLTAGTIVTVSSHNYDE